ncbi:MAG: ubiquitin-like domain-containing protein [Promethearchaeia archaeon]
MSFDDEFDEDLDEDLEFEEEEPEPIQSKTPNATPAEKTPAAKTPAGGGGKKITLYFTSTIGPGEKKQKLIVNDGNTVGDIKETVGNIFGLNPTDFHLSSGGVTMDDANPLSDYSVSEGDDVLLIPASTAGF